MCGFVAPPEKFQDPDVDSAKKFDLRNGDDLDSGDVPGLNADTNDLNGDGFDDNTGEPVDGDVQPMLSCLNCGYEVDAGEPQTVSTEDASMGDESSPSPGPQAGDLCPNCAKAPLMSPEELAESGMGNEQPGVDTEDEVPPGQEPDPNEQPPGDNDDDDPRAFASPDDEEPDDEDDDEDEEQPAKKPFPPKKK